MHIGKLPVFFVTVWLQFCPGDPDKVMEIGMFFDSNVIGMKLPGTRATFQHLLRR